MKKSLFIAFLISLGLNKEQAEKLTTNTPEDGGTDIPQADLDAILIGHKEKQIELLRNDKEFVSEIQLNESKKINEMWSTKIKQSTGLTGEEIKDKGYKDIIALAVDKLRKKGDATSEELQKINLELENKLKDLTENVLPGKLSEVENHKNELTIAHELELLIMSKDLGVSPTVAKAAVKAMMDGKVRLALNADKKLDLFQAGDGGLKVKKKDNSGFMSADDFITDVLTSEKLLKVSGGGGQGGDGGKGAGTMTTTSTTTKNDELYKQFPHLKSSMEHEKTVKETIDANAKK